MTGTEPIYKREGHLKKIRPFYHDSDNIPRFLAEERSFGFDRS